MEPILYLILLYRIILEDMVEAEFLLVMVVVVAEDLEVMAVMPPTKVLEVVEEDMAVEADLLAI